MYLRLKEANWRSVPDPLKLDLSVKKAQGAIEVPGHVKFYMTSDWNRLYIFCFIICGRNYGMLIDWERAFFLNPEGFFGNQEGVSTLCWLVISCLATKRYCRWNYNWNCILGKKMFIKSIQLRLNWHLWRHCKGFIAQTSCANVIPSKSLPFMW